MHGTYEFRKEMLETHRLDTLDAHYMPQTDEILIHDWSIAVAKNCDRVIYTGVQDLQDYLLTSLNTSTTSLHHQISVLPSVWEPASNWVLNGKGRRFLLPIRSPLPLTPS